MRGQGGIQMLLTAEQEAQQIVSAARNCTNDSNSCLLQENHYMFHFLFSLHNFSVKMTRLRQAKEEAEREVANYRSHQESEHQKKISEVGCLAVLFKSLPLFHFLESEYAIQVSLLV